MPIYEFRCRACGNEFEALVRVSDAPTCPSCHSLDLERMLSMFAVSSEERSSRALKGARQQATVSKERRDALRHEQEVVQEHLSEDYGLEPHGKKVGDV